MNRRRRSRPENTRREFIMSAKQLAWMLRKCRAGEGGEAWRQLGEKLKFKPMSAEMTELKSAAHFTAEPINAIAAS